MTTHELLELASLDAMGLLEPAEREAFDRAFAAADPAVQAMIRREQLRVTELAGPLNGQVVPPGLKARVLAAVRQAVAEARQAVGLRLTDDNVPAPIPAIRRAGSVSHWWRTAAIGAIAATIVLGFSVLQMRSEFVRTDNQLLSNAANDELRKLVGADFKEQLTSPNIQRLNFTAAFQGDGGPSAALNFDAAARRGHLSIADLPPVDGGYELVAIDEDGQRTRPLAKFDTVTNGLTTQRLNNLTLAAGETLIIRRVASGEIVLSAPVRI